MITLSDIQRHVGVTADGKIGPNTIAAIAGKLGIASPTRSLADPRAFFEGVKEVTGRLDQTQVDSINGILSAASHWPMGWVAYALATAWHESFLRPIPEIGKGRGRKYGVPGKHGGQVPYGRGFVQLTWDFNYEWADEALGLDGALLRNFELALDPRVATRILVKGMETGAFTKKKLSDFMPQGLGSHSQFVRSRAIINGSDRAAQIADYAMLFQSALAVGQWG